MPIPVIDLFAGPGGLGEGFSKARGADFHIAVSIEKDGMAFETLQLRAAHRALMKSGNSDRTKWHRWDTILAKTPWNIAFDALQASDDDLIKTACTNARAEAWNIELGPANRDVVSRGIRQRLRHLTGRSELPDNIVLIGGPPCQAYSVVGRARNRGTAGYKAEDDHRHFLYKEYLGVIKEFRPAVFIMENVKGILTSRVSDRQIFQTIIADLKRPDIASGIDVGLGYTLVALPHGSVDLFDPEPDEYIVEAESHGIPQARHRVIICGVRNDVIDKAGMVTRLQQAKAPTVGDVIDDLPRLRSALSFRGRGMTWIDCLDSPLMSEALHSMKTSGKDVQRRIASRLGDVRRQLRSMPDPGVGEERVMTASGEAPLPRAHARWYRDRSIGLLANHQCRSHMPSDVLRYLFVAAFGEETGESPRLVDFPLCLLPEHQNVDPMAPGEAIFKDRFRVQLRNRHSMTVTSHIAKDGHAFIHPSSLQCRSMTVREAARLQTFPDSYVFLGNRTSQYTQVGNAVPPYLAHQIAEIVADVLTRAGLAA
jgi:DNA (cytosine-5)-methyltransferase 1